MISVDQALTEIFALLHPLDAENVPLDQAAGRVLAHGVAASANQPPFASSAMDGYAVRVDQITQGMRFDVIGEAAAGHAYAYADAVAVGQAVRIFTGAPVPPGANAVIIQEDVARRGDQITVTGAPSGSDFIRPAGSDFKIGDALAAPRTLSAGDIALLAAMNIPNIAVQKRPQVALLATGDELVMPGEIPRDDQIIASNCFGLAAMVNDAGGQPRVLPIARDNHASLCAAFELAQGADLIVTVGGASVGDHDLVGRVAADLGMQQSFYKVAMRPGKPLMAGMLGNTPLIGLPGNPVSSMVCGTVFLQPAIAAMLGLPKAPAARQRAILAQDLAQNGTREHYMRAVIDGDQISACARQDSALLSVLSRANALIVRPVGDSARKKGSPVDHIPL